MTIHGNYRAYFRCDGEITIEVGTTKVNILKMKNGSTAMDYVTQNKAVVKFSVNDHDYESEQVTKKGDNEFLSMEIKQNRWRFFREFSQGVQCEVFAHFEMSHWYFWRLHCAISCADNQLIQRLVAPKPKGSKSNAVARISRGSFSLDREYQLQALRNMLSCGPGAPYLLLGPFGTGKTYVLAAAVDQLLKNPQNRILVCTHQNVGADKLYLSLQESLHAVQTAKLVLRLVPDDQGTVVRNNALMHPYSCEAVRNISVKRLSKWPAIITTFSTAFAIKDKHRREGGTLHFSTIIIDEGAQSREPEALGALLLADSDTHIIIAGDHQQVLLLIAQFPKVHK